MTETSITAGENPNWIALCDDRKLRQLQAIPKQWKIQPPPHQHRNVLDVPLTCGLLTPREREITDTANVDDILDKLSTAQWSSVEVTTAFYKRAIIAHQLTNCLTEIFIERALERAREVDHYLKTHGKPIGPLHGLPISLKDQFCLKGMETIMGYAGWIGRVSQIDSVLVEILYECGAVPFVRTNVPQTLQWGETYNHVFGRTTNPYNRYMTPGGSSGGEGALLALHGSPLGVGTDIGGSLRIPSAFCGLYTLRPSYERLPYCNAVNSQEGQESISSVLGPMANSLSGVTRFTKAIIDAQPWRKDPLCVRKDWSDREYALGYHGGRGAKMCFAIMWDNGVIKPQPPLTRALEMAKRALEAAGHTVIDWVNHRHLDIYRNGVRTIYSIYHFLSSPPIHLSLPIPTPTPFLMMIHSSPRLPSSPPLTNADADAHAARGGASPFNLHSPTTDAHEYALDEPLARTILGEVKHLSAYELWQLHREKRALRKSYLDHWEATVSQTGTGRPVDAIISPAVGYPACPHGCNSDDFYTSLCNYLDFTASVFPVTFVDKALDEPLPPHEFRNHEDEAVYKMYDPELFDGLPVGLQLVGRTLEEEGVIAMTEVVVEALEASKRTG